MARSSRGSLGYTVNAGVARLTLGNGPANRIDEDTARRICDAAEEIVLDDRVCVVLLEARGRSFCLGVEGTGPWEDRFDWVAAVGALTVPVIAAIQGDAFAEGLELALACDLRIVAGGARFALPQLGQGRLPRHGGTQYLPRIAGRTRAIDLLLSGRAFSAREALEMGVATEVVPRSRFAAAVRRRVAQLREKGPLALRLAKEAVRSGIDLTLGQGIRLEQDLYVLLQTSADRREGIDAFLDKRRPRFVGQ